MAKLIKTFENGIEKTELTFLAKTFTLTMMPTKHGSKSVEKCLAVQVSLYLDKYYTYLDEESEEFQKVADVLDLIDCEDNDDILEDLKILDEYERTITS